MTHPSRLLAAFVLSSLLLGSAATGRVHGLLLDPEGHPATGYATVLLDAEGVEVARGAANASGRYAVEGVPDGTFTLVVEAPDGSRAAVAAPPLAVRGRDTRMDLRLVEQGDEPDTAVPTSTGSWWHNLPTTGKVWVIAGTLALTAFAVAAVDDDAEPSASPF